MVGQAEIIATGSIPGFEKDKTKHTYDIPGPGPEINGVANEVPLDRATLYMEEPLILNGHDSTHGAFADNATADIAPMGQSATPRW
jgi:hypothetical protein